MNFNPTTLRKNTRAFKDLVIISVVAILTFALAHIFDMFDVIVELSRKYGEVYIDEFVIVLMVLAFASGVFSLRRWRELRDEVTECEQVHEAEAKERNLLRTLIETLPDRIYVKDTESRFVLINNAVMSDFRATQQDEIIGKTDFDFFPRELAERYYSDEQTILQSGEPIINKEESIIGRAGNKLWTSVTRVPLHDSHGNIVGLVGMNRDVTERKQIEEALRESEERYRTVIENQGEGIGIVDQEERFVFVNPAGERIFGVPEGSLIGRNLKEFTIPEQFAVVMEETAKRRMGERSTYELEIIRADGERRHILVTATPRFDSRGQFTGTFGIFLDITERKRAEEALRESEERFQRLSEAPFEGIVFHDQGKIIDANQAFATMFGYGLSETIGKNALDFAAPELREVALRHIRTGSEEPYDGVAIRKDGSTFPVEVHGKGAPYKGRTVRLTAVRDITERKRAEDTLRRSEEQHRLITGNTHDLICMLDQDGNFIYASPSFREGLGCEPEELMGSSFFSLVHPDDRVPAARTLPRALFSKNGRTVELRYRHQNGEWRIFESVWSWIFDENRSPQRAVVVSRDITERKQADQALRESEEKYRALFEESKDTIYISTPDGKFLDINPAGIELFGYSSKDEILQIDVRDLYINPSDRETFSRTIEQEGFVKDFESALKRKDGEKLIVIETASAMRDGRGNIVAYRGIMRDVTRQKQLEQQFLQAQKMESIGRLAGGVAHDFNNVLTAIMGSADLVSRIMGGEEKLSHYVGVIKQAARRGGDLAKQLLTFARLETYNMRPVIVNEVLEETIKLVERTFERSVEVKTRFADGIPFINGDAGQLEQVFMNLCVNARDAMPDGGTLTIETRSASVDDAVEQKSPHFTSGEYVEVSISDTGAGMDEKTLQHIFEPFFTTKERDKGTGLGLSVVYGIVQSHKGFIIVESTVGFGTTFRIYLPIPEYQAKGEVPAKQMYQEGVNGKGTVLIVDDDEMVQDLTEELLTGLGYHALKVGSGEECIEAYRERGKEIDLVILDMAMAKMNGEETFRRLKLLDADVKVLIASGLTELERRRRMEEAGIAGFLQKPYEIAELSNAVQGAME